MAERGWRASLRDHKHEPSPPPVNKARSPKRKTQAQGTQVSYIQEPPPRPPSPPRAEVREIST